jgi:hypothetical protein
MAEETTTRILDIQVNYSDAVAAIGSYNEKIEECKAKEKELQQQWKEGKISSDEYRKGMASIKQAAKEYSDASKDIQKEMGNERKAQQSNEGSLKQLRAELANATKSYDSLSRAEREGAKGKDLLEHINGLTGEIKNAEEESQRFQRNVGNYPGAVAPLRSQVRELKQELATMLANGVAPTDKAFTDLAEKTANLQRSISGASSIVSKFASKTRGLDQVINIGQTMAGTYGLAQSAMTLFGDSSEKAAQQAAKLQAVMTALQSLQALQNALMTKGTATNTLYTKALKLFGSASKEASAEQVALGATTEATGVAEEGAAVSAGVFKKALIATGLGAIIVLIGELIAHFDDISEWFSKTFPSAGAKCKEVIMGIWNAVKNYLIAPIKAAWKLLHGDFQGAVKEIKNGYDVVGNYSKGSAEQRKKNAEEAAKAEAKSMNTVKDACIKDNEAKYGSDWKYTSQGRKVYADYFASLLKMYDKNSDDYKEAQRKMWEYNLDVSNHDKDAAKERADAAKQAAQQAAEQSKQRAQEAANARKEAANNEREITREAEAAKRKLIGDSYEQQRADIQATYDNEIADLQRKLNTEKNLTAKARQELRALISYEQQLKNKELEGMEQAHNATMLQESNKAIDLMLDNIQKGSENELALKRSRLTAQYQIDTQATYTEYTDAVARYAAQVELARKYDADMEKLEDEHNKATLAAMQKAAKEQYDFELARATSSGDESQVLQVKLSQAKAELDAIHRQDDESYMVFTTRRLNAEKKYQDAQKALATNEVKVQQSKFQAISTMVGGIEDVMEAAGSENSALAKAAKVLALAEIMVNMGKAIAAAIAAGAGLTFPANLGAIASGVAAVTTGIASAIKTVKSAKFATGGYVSGSGNGTSDNIPAMLSNGESVMTANSTAMFAPILSAINTMGGGVPISTAQGVGSAMGEEMLARAVARGVSAMPAPVVSVKEINDTQSRVRMLEDMADV